FAVMLAIALFVATQFAAIGALLALWTMMQMLIIPAFRALKYLVAGSQLRARRRRALAVAGAGAAIGAAGLFVVPLPYATVAEGVVWVPDEAILRSGAEGFVAHLLVEPGREVSTGEPVIRLEDPVASAQVEVRRAELAVLQNRFTAFNQINL